MKKTALLLVAAVLALCLCSCASRSESSGGDSPSDSKMTLPAIPSQKAEDPPDSQAAPDSEPPAAGSLKLLGDPGPLSEQGAMDKVRDLTDAEYDVCFSIEGTDRLLENGQQAASDAEGYPVYLVHAYTGEGDHIATVGRYAVGIDDDIFWALDIVSGEYLICPQGSPLIDWSYGYCHGAAGLVVRNPDEYCKWEMCPILEYDASNGDPYAETVMICAPYDATEVVLLGGTVSQDDWTFSGDPVGSFRLDQGQYALIRCSVPELIPTFAVQFSAEPGVGTYVVWYDGRGEWNSVEYAFPDGAAG